jgi:hypothetical protein
MTKKSTQVAITIPRSFAALSKVASDDPERAAYMHTVLLEAQAGGTVRGTATDGHKLLRMVAPEPEVNLSLFEHAVDAAPTGTRAAPGAEDLATLARLVRPKADGPAPCLEIVVGDETMLRCGSEARRVQIEPGDGAKEGWPDSIDGALPTGEPLCIQVFGAKLLHELLGAILAAGGTGVQVEMRGGLAGLRLLSSGEDGEQIIGVLMPIKMGGEVPAGPDLHDVCEKAAAACRTEGMDVEVVEQ